MLARSSTGLTALPFGGSFAAVAEQFRDGENLRGACMACRSLNIALFSAFGALAGTTTWRIQRMRPHAGWWRAPPMGPAWRARSRTAA